MLLRIYNIMKKVYKGTPAPVILHYGPRRQINCNKIIETKEK